MKVRIPTDWVKTRTAADTLQPSTQDRHCEVFPSTSIFSCVVAHGLQTSARLRAVALQTDPLLNPVREVGYYVTGGDLGIRPTSV